MQSSIRQSIPPSILLGITTGRCGKQETGLGICSPSNISWVGLSSGQQEPNPLGLVLKFEVGISSRTWSCQPWSVSLCGYPLLLQLCSLTSSTHRFLSCQDQALPPCLSLRILISASVP